MARHWRWYFNVFVDVSTSCLSEFLVLPGPNRWSMHCMRFAYSNMYAYRSTSSGSCYWRVHRDQPRILALGLLGLNLLCESSAMSYKAILTPARWFTGGILPFTYPMHSPRNIRTRPPREKSAQNSCRHRRRAILRRTREEAHQFRGQTQIYPRKAFRCACQRANAHSHRCVYGGRRDCAR